MKTLRKIDLQSMQEELQVLNKGEEKKILGGEDCWWRCIAYIQTGQISEEAGREFAIEYCLPQDDSTGYIMSGNKTDLENYISSYITNKDNYNTGSILVVDTNVLPYEYDGEYHALVVNDWGDGSGNVEFYDPKHNEYITLSALDINASNGFYVNIK
ncbi:TIGR04149 family rSAM-modified RiPP [Bacteroidales bacterium OttesenSCG-928-M11]|nr:TIGR04149 family rSAM-modified RiPP [Bacteroidales bacterium OttesenSCG-928-M11]